MNRMLYKILLITVLAVTQPVLSFAQDSEAQLITALHQNPKIRHPEKVLRDFEEGKQTIRVVVRLSKGITIQQDTNFEDADSRKKLKESVKRVRDSVILRLDPNNISITNRFSYIYGFAAEVDLKGLKQLTEIDEVISVRKAMILRPHLAQGIPLMSAWTVRNQYNGENIAIAICDTGMDYTHAMLGGGGFPNSKVIGGYDFADRDDDPMDTNGHGTACAGIAAGDLGIEGDYIGGVAYNAKLYALKVTSGELGVGWHEDIIEAWEWCIDHQNDDPSNPIMIISTSLGGGYYTSECDSERPDLAQAAANVRSAGITIFASSGNEGYCDGIASPACLSEVISVGAVYDANIGGFKACISAGSCIGEYDPSCWTEDEWACTQSSTSCDVVPCYSNSASTLDIFAPSNNAYTTDIVDLGGYNPNFGGTSAACSYAAGAAACLQSAAKYITGSFLTPDEVRTVLTSTGNLITDDKAGITKPRINLRDAINAIAGVGISLGQAVDNVSLTWTTSGDADWFGQTEVAYYDGDAAQSGRPAEVGESLWIETTVEGPGVLSFYWKNSSSSSDFTFFIDRVPMSECKGTPVFQPYVHLIEQPGSHTLTWGFTREFSFLDAWLDKVNYSPSIPLGEALDNTSLIWTTGGDAQWFGQTEISYYDWDAARSGGAGSWLQTRVTGPGILTFYWREALWTGGHDLDFYIDGELRDSCMAYDDWEHKAYSIESEDHTLRWDFAPFSPLKAGLVDQVVFISEPAILVRSPNGGESWEHRTSEGIHWVSVRDWSSHVRIELYKGAVFDHTITSSSENDGYYKWLIPTVLPPASDYRIRVISTSDPSLYDDSNRYFEITETETSPLDGYLTLGADDFAAATDHAELDIGLEAGEDFTVEAWFYEPGFVGRMDDVNRLWVNKPESYMLGVKRRRESWGDSSLFCYDLDVRPDFTCMFLLRPLLRGWHHVALVRDGGQLMFYSDGELQYEREHVGTLNNSRKRLIVGKGEITVDEIRISDMARYTSTSFNPYTSPFTCDEYTRALWHFDEPEGATRFHDACGTDNILYDSSADTDGDGLPDYIEDANCTDLNDADTDDDGIPDGTEDKNKDGMVEPGETDPCKRDTDGDGIQDGTELGVTEPVPDPDGEGPLLGTDEDEFVPDADPSTATDPLDDDSDNDGILDGLEDTDHNGRVDTGETDPSDPLSRPVPIHLEDGQNLIAIPEDVSSRPDLRDWLPLLGDSSEIEKVMVYDDQAHRFITLIPGDPSNPSFILEGGEGLIVYAKQDKEITFTSVLCSSHDLEQGFNLVGFACPPDGYTAFQLLNDLGSEYVSSVQRYSTEKGAFETAGFGPQGQVAGVDFPIVPGEGYFIFMKQRVNSYIAYFRDYPVVANASINTFDQETLSYFWTYIDELETTGAINMDEPLELQNCDESEECPYVYPTDTEIKRIMAAKTAHSIWLDKNNILPWRLVDYSENELAGLFDKDIVFDGNSTVGYRFLSVVDYLPSDVYSYVKNNNLMSSDILSTVYAVLDDLRTTDSKTTFVHGVSDKGDPTRTAYALYDALTTYVDRGVPVRIARNGCQSMSRITLGVLRSVNIPGEEMHLGEWYLEGHSSAVWPAIQRVMPHGDDIYSAILRRTPRVQSAG